MPVAGLPVIFFANFKIPSEAVKGRKNGKKRVLENLILMRRFGIKVANLALLHA